MVCLGYFAKGNARTPGEEAILEPTDGEAVVFEEFVLLRGFRCLRTLLSPIFY
jgi:hypothetical protein